MKKQDTIELLQKQLPGFYSVDQVIELIDGIEESEVITTPKLTLEGMSELRVSLIRAIIDELDSLDQSDIVDFYSAEFSLCGNEIQLEGISWENNPFEGCVENGVNKVIHDFFEPADEEEN